MQRTAPDFSYVALNGDWVRVPPAAPLPPDTPPPAGLGEELRAAVREARRTLEEIDGRRDPRKEPIRQRFFVQTVDELMAVMSGSLEPREAPPAATHLAGWTDWRGDDWPAFAQYHARLEALLSRPGVTPQHLARLLALHLTRATARPSVLVTGASGLVPLTLLRRMARADRDLRLVLAACAPFGAGGEALLRDLLDLPDPPWTPDAPPLWQVVAEHPDLIDQALHPAGRSAAAHVRLRALELLALLPAPPRRFREHLRELSIVGDGRAGTLARTLLGTAPDSPQLIESFLTSRSTLERMAAARWLAERGDPSAIPRLRTALARQKKDYVCITLIEALDALGDDLRDLLPGHEVLDKAWEEDETFEGWLQATTDADACMPLDQLPELSFADGRPVPAAMLRRWVVRAAWYRGSRVDTLLAAMLQQLSRRSAEKLASHVLSAFIAYDTRRPTEAEARAYADQRVDYFLRLRKQRQSGITREQAHAQLVAQHRRRYARNAHLLRGVLALVWPGLTDETLLPARTYLRKHSTRVAQSNALLNALAHHAQQRRNVHPGALELLCAVAANHRNRHVRGHARALLETLAQHTGCSCEELADRAIPTLGLDERGLVTLCQDGLTWTVTLDANLQLVVRNAHGEILKRLPTGSEANAAARTALTDLRKELEQIVAQQSKRLQEAMRTGRIWRTAHIHACLFQHPIMGRLCQLLIFAGVDAQGRTTQTFRPVEDGSYSSAAHEPVEIYHFPGIGLAHSALLTDSEVSAWRQHLDDYKVVPPFLQLY